MSDLTSAANAVREGALVRAARDCRAEQAVENAEQRLLSAAVGAARGRVSLHVVRVLRVHLDVARGRAGR